MERLFDRVFDWIADHVFLLALLGVAIVIVLLFHVTPLEALLLGILFGLLGTLFDHLS